MLQELREKHQTKIFNKYCSFFAFNKEQLNGGINRNFKYTSVGSGLFIPTIFVKKVMSKLNKVNENAIKECWETHSKKDIIWYEFSNREVQFTGDLDDVIDALFCFSEISKEDIIAEYRGYYNHCCENDLF